MQRSDKILEMKTACTARNDGLKCLNFYHATLCVARSL